MELLPTSFIDIYDKHLPVYVFAVVYKQQKKLFVFFFIQFIRKVQYSFRCNKYNI